MPSLSRIGKLWVSGIKTLWADSRKQAGLNNRGSDDTGADMDSNKGYIAVAVLVVFLYNLFVKSTIKGMIDQAMHQMSEFAKTCITQMSKASDEAVKAIRDANKDNSVNMSVLIDKVGDEMREILTELHKNRVILNEIARRQRKEPGDDSPGSHGHYG